MQESGAYTVVRFNELLHERFSDTEEFLTVVDTIPPEFKFYYEDGLHFSNVGLSKSCSILLSCLYKVLAPFNLTRRKRSRISRGRIVGIQCDFPGYESLILVGVYLPSASRNLEEYCEYFDYLSALYDSLSSNGKVILMGGFKLAPVQ